MDNARARRVAEKRLGDDWSILITISNSPQNNELDLPDDLLRKLGLVSIRVGRIMNPPMPDLKIGGRGLSFTLTLRDGSSYHCFVPWNCVSLVSASNGCVLWRRGSNQPSHTIPQYGKSGVVVDMAKWKSSKGK